MDVDVNRRVLFFVDEVGQFVGNNTQMMLKLQTITENLGTQCGGRAWIVVTSQEDIDAVLGQMKSTKGHDFSKIQGRFERLSLSSSNTSEVIEKRLLLKDVNAIEPLQNLYQIKGDILRHQLAFDDKTTAELANYKDTDSFVSSYPFVPYHYILLQKIFEAIRKAGATGLHLSRGERSLLDAFQSAAKQVAESDVGVLIPLYYFYPAIESFLDTAVKKDIDQAGEKDAISAFALNLLKTLFLIRYVDVIKSTIDNLVTLSISKVDEDCLSLRREIEYSLDALERNLLIARQGDEYVFLTNEEKEIENEIRETAIELADENKKLSDLIFDDILRRDNQYKYPQNNQSFPISRFCNGMPRDGSQQHDLILKVISPLDPNYVEYETTVCANLSQDDNKGTIIIKLAAHERVFEEIRTFIKTDKFLRKNIGNRPEQQQLLHQKGAENQRRNNDIKTELEDLLKQADYFALGSQQNPKGGAINTILDELYRYVIENTFSKLKWVKPFAGDIRRETQNTLVADDLSQIGLDLTEELVNPQAIVEVEKFVELSDAQSRVLTVEDTIQRFAKRPFGWHSDEIILIIARLALANKICLQMRQQEVPLKNAYEHLIAVRRRTELRIRIVKQQSKANLKQAAKLYKDFFRKNAPTTGAGDINEKELFNVATLQLNDMKDNLQQFASKASTGQYPGVELIEHGIVLLAGLLAVNTSYQFIEAMLERRDELLDFEEDYEELADFYHNQFSSWQKLQKALELDFERNRSVLEHKPQALEALQQLERIYCDARPYRDIRKIEPLINQVAQINQALLLEKRALAKACIDKHITKVQQQLTAANVAKPESEKILKPLQTAHSQIDKLIGISDILQQQAESTVLEEHAFSQINQWIDLQAQERKQQATASTQDKSTASQTTSVEEVYKPQPSKPYEVAEPTPKKVIYLQAASLMNDINSEHMISNEQDIERYLAALKDKLTALVNDNNKVLIR